MILLGGEVARNFVKFVVKGDVPQVNKYLSDGARNISSSECSAIALMWFRTPPELLKLAPSITCALLDLNSLSHFSKSQCSF